MFDAPPTYTAFVDGARLAHGPIEPVLAAWKAAVAGGVTALVFRDGDARSVSFDPADTAESAARRAGEPPAAAPAGRGRPRLGVVAREVTLLPRHWDWLSAQPGGASIALRKLVEAAMRDPADAVRRAREAAYRFLTATGGDRPHYEDALRALFAGDRGAFDAALARWPEDLRAYVIDLSAPAWPDGNEPSAPEP